MSVPGIHVSSRLMAGSIVAGAPIRVVGSPLVGVYRLGIPQVVLDPDDGDSIDVRIVRGNGDLTRPSNVPWSVVGTGPNPLLRTDFVGGAFPTGTAPFAVGDTEFLVQLNFAGGQPPAVARTGALVLGVPDWGTVDPSRPDGVLVIPHVLPPDEDLSSWQTAWIDPASDVPSTWVLWGGTAAGAAVGYSAGKLRVYAGSDPTAPTQRVALWNRTPLPGTDWRLSFTYARADTAAPTPPAAVATTLLLGCAGKVGGAYPAGILTYVGADTTAPSMAHLVANLDGLRLDLDNLHGPDDGRHVAYDLPAPPTPGGGRITPASDPDFVFTPPALYDVAVEKVGGALTVKWRPQGGAWEDYTVAAPVHAGVQWGLFVTPNRDASFSNLTVASYLGDVSRLLPFDPTPSYDDQLDAPAPSPVELRTVSTVAQLLSAHDTIAPGGHIVVADGVILSQDFDLARSLPPGQKVVLRANSPQGATLDCDIRILGDGWEVRDLKQAPRQSAAARIRILDADRVRVSRIDCSSQTGAFAVITVEGDRPCDDITIDRCTIQGHTTWAIALLATADKNVVLAWNEIPGSLATAVGGGVLVGADSQANGLALLKVAAYNRIAGLRGPHGFLVRASRAVYYRNTLAKTASGACDIAVDNGTDNFYVANELSGGSRVLVRGLVPVILGNKSRGAGATNPACVLFAGNYDPVSDGFEPGYPTQAQLQQLTGIAGIQPREAVSGALLASNDFEGTISVGSNAVADAVRPVPARNTSVFDHTGNGLASAGAAWDAGTQYRPAAARPAGISAPSTFPLAAGDAGVRQDDSILNLPPPPPGKGDPVKPWWKIPGGNRSGKLWNRGPGLTFSTSAWTPTMGPYDVTTGASHRSESTMDEVIGGPVSATLTDYDDVSKIMNGSQVDWPGTTMQSAAADAVPGKTWLIWVMDTNPTGGPFDTSNGPGNTTFKTWASPGPHDDMWYAMGRRARAQMVHYGLQPWQLMLRINHEMVQSNNYQLYYSTGPDYAKAMGRFIDGFRRGYSAHSPDDYARMIFSPSRHYDCGPLERFFTCDPVALTTPYDLVDVSAHPASTMDSYASATLAVQTQQAAVWIAGGHDAARDPDNGLPPGVTPANYAQNCTVDDHSMIKLAKKYKIGMCNSEWSPRYDLGGCQVAPGVYQAMHDWFTQNAAWYAFECVFHSNTLQDLPAITNWRTGKLLFISLWTNDPAEKAPAPVGTNPGATHTGQLTLSGGKGGGPNRSGLPWASGMCDDSSLAGMMVDLNAWETARGRLCDVSTQFFGRQHTSWTQLTDNFLLKAAGLVPRLVASGITPALTIAHFSSAMPGLSVAAAARGDYDAYHLAAAQKIAALGVPVIIRLGHECDDDGNVYSYYHSGVTVADYKAMFRRQALIYLGTIGPTMCRIDWNHLRQAGQATGHDDDPDTFYPGDDVVQIISADCYGNSPRGNPSGYVVTDADWLAYLNNASPNGHPQGPGTWLAYAVAKGKQFACPEWGVTNWMGPNTIADSARYIQGMYEFFRDNASDIAYESYFNRIAGTAAGSGGHKLLPAVDNPLASAEYMSEWAQVVAASKYTFGADWNTNWLIKKGNATKSLVAQPATDTVVLTAGATNSDQAALFFLCRQRPATNDGTWSFYYKRLDANVHTDTLGIGTHFLASYVGAGGTIPANPSAWPATIYKPVSGDPCGDSILALDGDGLRIGFDEVNEPAPANSNVLDAVAYQRSLARPALGLAARQVNLAALAPGVEWLVTVVLSGRTLSFSATAVGQPAVSVTFDDALIAAKAGGWFGFRLDRGRSCQLRALTYLPG